MMKLSVLIDAIKEKVIQGDLNIDIFGLDSDSRKIEKGHLFVAIKGTANDGHEYINKAIEQGATAVVCEDMPSQMEGSVAYIQVKDSADALGKLAAQWYGNPADFLTLVGVTGTNGKTTIATLLYNLFKKLGYKTGLLSTVCNYVDDKAIPATHTTPDPISLNMLLAEMVKAGCTHAFMEVSSHSVDQKRISGLNFDGGIFTNLTRDHLDYHKTVDAYLKAKKGFFDQLPKSAFALTNLDDKSGMVMLQNTAARKLTYSLRSLADFKGRILEKLFEGTLLEVNGTEVMVHFVGKFNAYNLLAVYGAAVGLGEDPNEALLQISTLHPVSGRFETIRSDKGFTAIVDYAHTPDALTNVLNAIHEVLNEKGRVITVVGAGGNRDKGKRPLMAKESVKYSEQVILTSDNPRYEEPDAIIEDMTAGLDNNEMKKVLCITDRKQAIKTAVMIANAGDVILIAGKGHEDYQDVKGVKHHFDDREIVKEFI